MMAKATGFESRLLVTLGLSVIVACGAERGGPEAELYAWIDAVQQAAEEKDRRGIIDRISTSYIDARGNGRDDIENRLRVYFLRQGGITVIPTVNDIRIFGETAAEVSLTVAMAGTSDSRLGISADAYRFELELEKVDGDWALIAARWGELGEQLR